jgi:hypothetical protein
MGPFNDTIYAATSNDGLVFEVLPEPLFEHASVPDVVELTQKTPAGTPRTLLLYFVDFRTAPRPGAEPLAVTRSRNGVAWSQTQRVILEGKRHRGAAVDPSVVELPDGRLRMYFFGPEAAQGDPTSRSSQHRIYSAVSQDGILFSVEPGIRFEGAGITDPEVIRTKEEWLMFLSSGQQTLLARSRDGLAFTLDEAFRLASGGVLEGSHSLTARCESSLVAEATFSARSLTLEQEPSPPKNQKSEF